MCCPHFLFQIFLKHSKQLGGENEQIFIDSFFYQFSFSFTMAQRQINLLMEQAKLDQINWTHIKGRNFQGKMQVKGECLRMDLTQFKKGTFYMLEITNANLQKEFRRFLIFKKVTDLFDEIASNEFLQISDENTFILPVRVIYKGKEFELKVQIPLVQRKFSNQSQKLQHLFEQFQKLNQLTVQLVPKLINFRGDETNQQYKYFQLSENKKRIKIIENNKHGTFYHAQPLKKRGIYYFKVRIIKFASTKYIFSGICGKQCFNSKHGYDSPYFMGFYLCNGHIYRNNQSYLANSAFTVVQGQSIIKVIVDMNKQLISWFHNDNKLYTAQIVKELRTTDIYLMVNLYNNGDIVEFIDE